MREMVARFLRQKVGSLGIALILATLAVLTALTLLGGRDGPAPLALILVAAGAVSRDVAGGTVQMILARPIRRSEYLMGRYLGILVTYGAFLLLAALICLALQRWTTGRPGAPLPLGHLLRVVAGAWIDGALLAATFLFFSTFLPGVGDLLAYFMLMIGLGAAGVLQEHFPGVAKAAHVARENLFPQVPWPDVLRGDGLLAESTGRFVLTLAVFLLAALFIFSRREFSYGHD